MNGSIQNAQLVNLRNQGYEVYEHRWLTTDDFKEQLGFVECTPRMYRKWVRTVGAAEDGAALQLWGDTVYLRMGHNMIYDPTSDNGIPIDNPDQLAHWPVDPIEYALTYSPFPMQVFPYEMIDESTGRVGQSYLTPTEMMLASIGGFSPVYKSANIWAKIVKSPTAILGLEHTDEPTTVPIGAVLALGISGEPYFMKIEKFRHLYRGELY